MLESTSAGLSRYCYYVSCCYVFSVELSTYFCETIGAGFGGGVAAMGYGSKGFDYVTISFCVSVSGWTPSISDPFKDYSVSVGSVISVSDFVSISYLLLS